MATFESRLNDWFVPAALGAMLYFLQAIAHDNQEFSRNIAIVLTRMDAYERHFDAADRRLDALEEARPGPRRLPH